MGERRKRRTVACEKRVRRPLNHDDVNAMQELYALGLSPRAIAREFSIPQATADRFLGGPLRSKENESFRTNRQ